MAQKSNGARISPLVAGATGAVAGAVGAALAAALADRSTRQKMGGTIKAVGESTAKAVRDLQKKAGPVSEYVGNMKGGRSTKSRSKKRGVSAKSLLNNAKTMVGSKGGRSTKTKKGLQPV
jgi:hypothetical protein